MLTHIAFFAFGFLVALLFAMVIVCSQEREGSNNDQTKKGKGGAK